MHSFDEPRTDLKLNQTMLAMGNYRFTRCFFSRAFVDDDRAAKLRERLVIKNTILNI